MAPDVYDKSGAKQSWAWLLAKYGDVRYTQQSGKRFALLRVDETEGPAVLQVRVRNLEGKPQAGQPVADAWPNPEIGGDVRDLRGGGLKRLYADVACVNQTNTNGDYGFGLYTDSYYLPPDRGAHTVWVLSPSVDSDGISGIGMFPGTEHMGPLALTFQLVSGEPVPPPVEPPPSTGTGSKLAWHFQNVPAWAARVVNSAYCKIIDPGSTNPFPGARTIGRFYIPDAEEAGYVARGAAGAADYFNRMLPRYQAASWVWAVECTNEPGVATAEQRENLVAFTRAWTDLMHSHGFRVVVLNLSVGWPDVGCAAELAGALETADYLGLHEYAAPTMQSGDGWLTLRYRKTVAELRAAGARTPPIIIGELGIDGGVLNPPQPKRGWKSFTNAADYLAQLQWYDSEIRKDACVEAATVFTSGPNGDWVDFDVDESLSRQLAAYIASQQGTTPPPPPPVTPPPPPPVASDMVAAIDSFEVRQRDDIANLRALAVNMQPQPAASRFALRRPVKAGDVEQWFGENPANYAAYGLAGHEALDYAVPVGTPVLATHDAQVSGAHNEGVYGLHILLDDPETGLTTVYAHLSETLVTVGQRVKAGDVIGKSGNTGRSTGPHLHWGVRVDGVANPAYGNWLDPVLFRKLNGDA